MVRNTTAASTPMHISRRRLLPNTKAIAISLLLLTSLPACRTWQTHDPQTSPAKEAPVRLWWTEGTATGIASRSTPDSLYLYGEGASVGCVRCDRAFAVSDLDSIKVKNITVGGTFLVGAGGAIAALLIFAAVSVSGMD